MNTGIKMIEIVKGTLDERIIRLLQEQYPITLGELSKKLGVSERTTRAALLKLQSRRIVELEPLPDTVFIRLIRFDFVFVGRRTQYKFIKKKRVRHEPEEEEGNDDIMYG